MNQRIKTDPVPEAEYPPRLPAITRVPVIIEGDRFREIDPETGETLGEGMVVRVREEVCFAHAADRAPTAHGSSAGAPIGWSPCSRTGDSHGPCRIPPIDGGDQPPAQTPRASGRKAALAQGPSAARSSP